ncbi:hypothetical protein BC826DRAFT_629861 [Russula brevipes]|nr:hypothetical protein BC826DRAFT_629861 [Russula brevipes]
MRAAASETGVTNLRTIMGFGSCFNKKSSSYPWTYASFPATVGSPMLPPGITVVPAATQPYYSYSHPPQLLAPLSPAIVPMTAPVQNVYTAQALSIPGQPPAMMQPASSVTYYVPVPFPVPVPSPSPPPPPPPHVPSPVIRSPLPAQRNPSPSRSYQPIITGGNDHWSYPQSALANNGPGGGPLLFEPLQPQQGAAQQASPYNLTLNLHVTTPYHRPTQLDDATPTPTRSESPAQAAPALLNEDMPDNTVVSPPTPPPHPSRSPRVPMVTGTYQPCANAQVSASFTLSPSPRWRQPYETGGNGMVSPAYCTLQTAGVLLPNQYGGKLRQEYRARVN